MSKRRLDEKTGVETTGHEWDGIEELDNPIPLWLTVVFVLSIVSGVIYAILYATIPLGKGDYAEGVLPTSRQVVEKELAALSQAQQEKLALFRTLPVEKIKDDETLRAQAIELGKAAFQRNCVICHAEGGTGQFSYPNLTDDDWLWGKGRVADIEQTLLYGIRSGHPKTRTTSRMTSFKGLLSNEEMISVSRYVLSLSSKTKAPHAQKGAPEHHDDMPVQTAELEKGATIFADNCALCHGANGQGDPIENGAPNLTDQIWLYGHQGQQPPIDEILSLMQKGPGNVMPYWEGRLDKGVIKALSVYVDSIAASE